MNNYEITLKVLKNIKQITPVCEESDTSRSAEDFRETHKALDKIMKLVESEMERQLDQEAHSEVTLEMEMGKDIPLREWARNNKLDESYARQKARRGSLKTAHKIGRDWFINELEMNVDNRRK